MSGQATATAWESYVAALKRHLARLQPFQQGVAGLRAGRTVSFEGVSGSSCALVAAALAEAAPEPLLVVVPNPQEAERFCEDLEAFGLAGQLFPLLEADQDEEEPASTVEWGERLRVLKGLHRGEPPGVIVAPAAALLQPVPASDQLQRHTRVLRTGQIVDADELAQWLVEHGFQPQSAVELPGEFSRRGGIFDLFAPEWDYPVRLEFFDDELESIRRFDPYSQRSIERLTQVDLTLVGRTGGAENSAGKQAEAAPAYFVPEYLPRQAWVLLWEAEAALGEAGAFVERAAEPQRLESPQKLLQQLQRHPLATAEELAAGFSGEELLRLPFGSAEPICGSLEFVQQQVASLEEEERLVVLCDTEAEAHRMEQLLRPHYRGPEEHLQCVPGRLHRGFRYAPLRTTVVGAVELLQRVELPRRRVRYRGQPVDSFHHLEVGDLVVHVAHGIARFRGVEKVRGQEQVEEHLVLEFAEGVQLRVPVSRIHLVQKYVGSGNRHVRLSRYGGKSWHRQRQAAQQAAMDLAQDLLQRQARRQVQSGVAFDMESPWLREFEAAFPYVETPDQQEAIAQVHQDMRRSRPMDRLICGDVGFGKTEIAMRAAFRAVDHGYQVAVLVPTTLLCEQHYRTFTSRMAEYPIRIARLSRFCSAKEQKQILEELRQGRLDILIGTHRLIQPDVQFARLGLVVIDEEQRFGVEMKERLKRACETVDVLTLSATPIPRTLHMALVGLRDISNLETPPEDRHAVQTRLARFEPELVRHAILRELNRGGQVFFVHNRVAEIYAVREQLRQIVPEARIEVGHAQMPEHELEEVMLRFLRGQVDVLVCTTIVESGLDFPRANTIFINQAQRFGLADLHQLRGRVGRYHHQAYCYLLVDPQVAITPQGRKRLQAIAHFSQLGAGFHIAMRDLEIRGAGNLLGKEQSGHISAVGYHLYCQLLEDAVRALRREPPRQVLEVSVQLPGEAYLPDDYVADRSQRLDLYRRLCQVPDEQALQSLAAELEDRYGPLPPQARRFLRLIRLRLLARNWQITQLRLEQPYLVADFVDALACQRFCRHWDCDRCRAVDQQTVYWRMDAAPEGDPDPVLTAAEAMLRP